MAVQIKTHDIYEPARHTTTHSEVAVPGWRAALAALAVGIAIAILGLAVPETSAWSWRAWLAVIGLPVIATFLTIFFLTAYWMDHNTLLREEHRPQVLPGEPEEEVNFTSVNQGGKPALTTAEKGRARFIEFINACFDHNPDTDTWLSLGFTRVEIKKYLAILMRPDVHGAIWRNPDAHQRGLVMTRGRDELIQVAHAGIWNVSLRK